MTSNRLLVEPQRNSEINPDGVVYTGRPTTTFVADRDKIEQICSGRIISVGPGKRHPKTGKILPVGVETGQYVAFSDSCHRSAGIDNEDWIILRNDDVMFISDEPIEHCSLIYH